MIQDIYPKHLDNHYEPYKPAGKDTIFCFEGSEILAKDNGESELIYPVYEEFASKTSDAEYKYIYLFSIDDDRFFLAMGNCNKVLIEGYYFYGVNLFRKAKPKDRAFAAITAFHLYNWYKDNIFCGRCGKAMVHDGRERMMRCECCRNMVYPKICPAVIVAVTNNDKILLTKYAGRTYTNYALIAGFTEIGETIEETVHREVMEEVQIRVKNLTYYKSQPWALSGSLLTGFFCEVDGDDYIHIDEDELSLGTWVEAKDLDLEDDGISLTREMILEFKRRVSNA
ncbi:MAG: NAD(+) diphosphatase [Eubacteriales bacterium]|nr:NAD(+) diphosphatase [Eubacteriales bacterium]